VGGLVGGARLRCWLVVAVVVVEHITAGGGAVGVVVRVSSSDGGGNLHHGNFPSSHPSPLLINNSRNQKLDAVHFS
jgi:hypothetical protein